MVSSSEVSAKGNSGNPRGGERERESFSSSGFADQNDGRKSVKGMSLILSLRRRNGRFRLVLVCFPARFSDTGWTCSDLVFVCGFVFVDADDVALYKELWHACAGPLVTVPRENERVFYFPQGHIEQVNIKSLRRNFD